MLVRKEGRKKFENSPKCIAYEYEMNDKDINIAYIEIDGRYPDKGRVTNEKVKEIVFVAKGSGEITVEGNTYCLKKDDAILLLPKQKYFFSDCKKLGIIAACSPAWFPEQHKNVK